MQLKVILFDEPTPALDMPHWMDAPHAYWRIALLQGGFAALRELAAAP
jgi:hypothetical protein